MLAGVFTAQRALLLRSISLLLVVLLLLVKPLNAGWCTDRTASLLLRGRQAGPGRPRDRPPVPPAPRTLRGTRKQPRGAAPRTPLCTQRKNGSKGPQMA